MLCGGENNPLVRTAASDAFEFLGLKLDSEENAHTPEDLGMAIVAGKMSPPNPLQSQYKP